jgi:putative DNA primase/helicase
MTRWNESAWRESAREYHNGLRNGSTPLKFQIGAAPGLEILCLADVTPKAIEWLWPNWIAIGKVSVLAGNGGQGKSTILCDLAARTTNGENWPDGAPGGSSGGVLILAAEDDVEDTQVPRLIAAGADLRMIHTVRSVRNGNLSRRTFSLQADLEQLEQKIEVLGDIRLVIIDPISSYLGKVDSHKNADVRSVLEPLGEMAARLRVAVICNNHFAKGGKDANSSIIGSVAFVNQARAAFIVTPDAEDPEGTRLLLMPSKMNIAPIKHGLAYRIGGRFISGPEGEIGTSEILWESTPVTKSADDAIAAHFEDDQGKTAKAEAIDFIKTVLAGGPLPAGDVQRQAREAGVTAKSLRSARETLGVKSEKVGFEGKWVLSLPKMPSSPEDAHVRRRASSTSEGIFDEESGHEGERGSKSAVTSPDCS